MEFKNITPFSHFKRIYEASIPNEFGNTTGFKQSLVGRAMFGILRYFMKGINLGKLEYYKRKLENEYFAGLLRFCAVRDINLATGEDGSADNNTDQPQDDDGGTTTAPDPNEVEYCNILRIDYMFNGYRNKLAQEFTIFSGHTQTLNIIINDPNASQDDKDQATEMHTLSTNVMNCCREKRNVNDAFEALKRLSGSTDQSIPGLLDQIKAFFSGNVAKLCSTYKGTDNEKNLLKSFENTQDQNIKTKIDEILPLLESYYLYDYDLINEKITSSLNKKVPLEQLLGDQLTEPGAPTMKVNIYDWLAKRGFDDVNKINFTALEKLFKAKPNYKEEVAKTYVNKEGIKRIQYAVSRIIFHTKKTPDDRGINPGEGGAVDYTADDQLKTSWEKKVQFVRSEFDNFINFDIVDPFILLNLNDALRKRDQYGRDPNVLSNAAMTTGLGNSIALSTKANQLGLIPLANSTNVVNERRLLVFTVTLGNIVFYPVLSLKNTQQGKIYRYIGNINFQKILTDKEYEKTDFKNNAHNFTTAIWDRPKSGSDTAAINMLKLTNTPILKSNYKFEGMYLTMTDYSRINSYKDNPKKRNSRLLYVFVANNQIPGDFATTSAGANNFAVQYLYQNNLVDLTALNTVKTSTDNKYLGTYFGETYEIESSWYATYFNTGDVSKYITTNPCLGDPPFAGVINLLA